MITRQHPFDLLVQQSRDEVRVAEAALLFARDHCPDLKPARWLEHLDGLARKVAALGARTVYEQVEALQTVLVEQERFDGNRADYYDPRNSLLHFVLQRRVGIPITLSAVWLDVCDRLNWPFAGVGLPGHYIIRCVTPGSEILVDPFNAGRVLTREDCNRLVSSACGQPVTLCDKHFQPVTRLTTLNRMLNNLRLIYMEKRAWYNASRVIERLLALNPECDELREELACVNFNLAKMN